jgi:DNA-binding response OmpR family regulator
MPAAKKKIIIVDDNSANLSMCQKALKELYDVYPAHSAEKMFDLLKHIIPDFIMLDVLMPDTNGYEAIRMLKSSDVYRHIPVIFLSALDDPESEMTGLDLGAVDYIHKPFVKALLHKRIETHAKVIEGKHELLSLNKSIEDLLTPKTGNAGEQAEAGEDAVKYLLLKDRLRSRMEHELRAPLNNIIEMIENAIKADDINEIKHCLGRADVETRLILEIIDDTLDVPD